MINTIYPCIWFNNNAREAAEFYCSVFKGTSITADNQMVVMLKSSGQNLMLLNGGPMFVLNPSISFIVVCDTEEEIDNAWKLLFEGGTVLMPLDKYEWSLKYGWIQDRYGVNWQLSYTVPAMIGQKFTPTLMFTDNQAGRAGEAIKFYTSLFEGSGTVMVSRYSKEENDVEGTIKHAQFMLRNRVFAAMDSSFMHGFRFNEALSFVVECDTQKEIDFFWSNFTRDGEESQCGWLKDRYGVSWQIIPSVLSELMSDPAKSERVINAFLKMKKFEIEKLINA